MSQKATQIYQLQEQTDRLLIEVAELQAQVAAGAGYLPRSKRQAGPQSRADNQQSVQPDEQLWALWPYCWVIDGWACLATSARARFHRFHEKRLYRGLVLANERSRQTYARRCRGRSESLRLV